MLYLSQDIHQELYISSALSVLLQLRLKKYQQNTALLTPLLLHFWSCTTNITKSCLINHSCYTDPRNHILKFSLYIS